MTQQEKAKAYDEAIIRAKSLIGDTIIEESGQHIAEVIFPELKESEDKKIKEWLIRLINTAGYRELDTDKMPCSRKNVIAWLEKQGEQKKSYDTCDSSMMDNKKSPYSEKRDFGYFEEKPADKVEPKFKVGDWIINRTDAIIMQIINNKDFYESVEIGGQRRTDTYNYVEWDFRLW